MTKFLFTSISTNSEGKRFVRDSIVFDNENHFGTRRKFISNRNDMLDLINTWNASYATLLKNGNPNNIPMHFYYLES